ncbi:MAG: glycosyltransferase family 4 protein, partial [archaeon]
NIIILAQYIDPNIKELSQLKGIEIIELLTPEVLNVYNGELSKIDIAKPVKRVFSLINYNRKVFQLLKTINPDLIWSLNWRGVITIGPVARILKIPLIYQIGLGIESKGYKTIVNNILLYLSSFVFIESKSQIKKLYNIRQRDVFFKKFIVLPFGIDTEKFNLNTSYDLPEQFPMVDRNSFIVGIVCSLTPRKGIEDLLIAINNVKNMVDKEVYLVIVGGDVDKEKKYYYRLKEKIKELNIQENVFMVGWQEDVPHWLAGFDVFVLPSKGEGIPVSVRESMAMGVPVIATNVGGISDIVINSYNGILIEPDNINGLVDAIKFLIEDPESLALYGKNAHKTVVEKFSIRRQVQKYETAFEIIVKYKDKQMISERIYDL